MENFHVKVEVFLYGLKMANMLIKSTFQKKVEMCFLVYESVLLNSKTIGYSSFKVDGSNLKSLILYIA